MTPPTPPPPLNVLVIDDEFNIRRTLAIYLEAEGHRVTALSALPAAFERVRAESFDLVFLDVRLETASGIDALPELISSNPWISVIVMTAHSSIESAVVAIRRGAVEYLTKPFQPRQLDAAIGRVTRVRALEQRLAALEPAEGQGLDPRVLLQETGSPAMRQAIRLATQGAASDASVLICGESGTGKGVLASFIHGLSKRAAHPFVTVAAPSLAAALAESDLFGHARGAFTGAVRDYAGKVAAADRGTLFLDEIDHPPRRRPLRLCHERRPRRRRPRRPVPSGPALPHQRPTVRPAASARPPRRHPARRRAAAGPASRRQADPRLHRRRPHRPAPVFLARQRP